MINEWKGFVRKWSQPSQGTIPYMAAPQDLKEACGSSDEGTGKFLNNKSDSNPLAELPINFFQLCENRAAATSRI
jgi:hypothetical protein